jgi:hypothetical protein
MFNPLEIMEVLEADMEALQVNQPTGRIPLYITRETEGSGIYQMWAQQQKECLIMKDPQRWTDELLPKLERGVSLIISSTMLRPQDHEGEGVGLLVVKD